MKNIYRKPDSLKRSLETSIALVLAISLLAGCASRSETSVRRETTSSPSASTVTSTTTSPSSETVVVEKQTKVEEHHDGGLFHIVGEILAFPFQLVADVFRFIF